MNINVFYSEIMSCIKDTLIVGGALSLTVNLIVMLLNMLINAATGRGFRL